MARENITKIIMMLMLAILTVSLVPAYSPEDAINHGTPLGLEVLQVKINGDVVENGDTITTRVERGDKLSIKVQMLSNESLDNVEVEAFISGDEHTIISDTSDVFDVEADEITYSTLELELPDNMEQDHYDLRVLVSTRSGQVKVYNYNLRITTQRHGIEIRDVVFSSPFGVKAGQGLYATVRLKNVGLKDEEGIKVTISIPELGLSYSEYIDEIEAEDQVTSEELWLGRVPECATPGVYTAQVKVLYDEYTRQVSTTKNIKVLEGDLCHATEETGKEEAKESILVPTDSQDITAGVGGAVYAVVINNPTDTAKIYTISVSGVEGWGTARVDPSNIVKVDAGDSKSVSIYVAANKDATAGVKPFVVKVESATSSAEVMLKANVSAAEETAEETTTNGITLVQGLQIALLILIVLIVILGLILIFNKMKGKDEETETTQAYY